MLYFHNRMTRLQSSFSNLTSQTTKNHIYLNRTTDRILQPKEKINIFEKREYWIAGPFISIREG